MIRQRTVLMLHAVLFLSGAGGLGCQVIWSRMFAFGLGQEMPSVLGVVAAMLTGLALGAWGFDRWPVGRRRPLAAYAALEGLVAVWTVATVWLVPWAAEAAIHAAGLTPGLGRQWAVAFGVPLLALLPATAALGATLPAMEAVLHRGLPTGRWVGSLYAVQTIGAVLGVLGGGLGLAAWAGERVSLLVLAAANGGCALGAFAVGYGVWRNPPEAGARIPREPTPARDFDRGRLVVLLAGTGLLGMGFEVLAVRALRGVLEGTVYTFALVLAVYLLGTALGAAMAGKMARTARTEGSESSRLRGLWFGLAVAAWAGWWWAAAAPVSYDRLRAWGGDSLLAAGLAEGVMAAGVLLPAAFFMGWTFASLAEIWRARTGGVGTALAVNLLGGAVAPLLFGVILTPWWGLGWAGCCVVLGYLGLAWLAGRSGRNRWFPLAALGWAGLALLGRPTPGQPRHLPPGSRVLVSRVGVSETVHVVETPDGERSLRVGQHLTMGGTAAAGPERLQAAVPLLLHPGPHRALFLGAGTAITAGAARDWPGLEATAVELLPEVVAVAPFFASASGYGNWPERLKLVAGDARRWMRVTPARYDVIVGDLFHPGRDGAAGLFTREQFAAVRARLAPGGLFCQWLPLHQLQGPALRSVMRTFLEVFPQARAWWLRWDARVPVLGLVGEVTPRRHHFAWPDEGGPAPETLAALKPLALADPTALLARFAGDAARLRRWAGDAPLNTDDHPVVAFLAPRQTVRVSVPSETPVTEWLAWGPVSGEGLLPVGASAAERGRLRALLTARDAFLRGLMAERRGDLKAAVAGWLESARLSPDFTTGYARCLALALTWSKERPAAAETLLGKLEAARPENPVAAALLHRLFPPAGAPAPRNVPRP